METGFLAQELAKIFGLPQNKVGFSGRKDKWALTIQWFSLDLSSFQQRNHVNNLLERIEEQLPVKIKEVSYHTNALKAGHLLGNNFKILLSGTSSASPALVNKIQKEIEKKGLPNFFGPQRFGYEGKNLETANKLLERNRPFRKKEKFYASVLQAHLFNLYLILRIQENSFLEVLEGDICKKHETGGIFLVKNAERERKRFLNKEISFTGPIYGYKMKWPLGKAKKWEEEILAQVNLEGQILRQLRWKGSRRVGRIFPKDWTIQRTEEGFCFSFFLPKGSYATILMREFQKTDNP